MARMSSQLNLVIDPELMERSRRIAESFDEFEGKHSKAVRQAIREFVDRRERELAERENRTELQAA